MDCQRARSLLSEYVDGYLGTQDSAELRAHLDRCPSCAREHAEFRRLVAILRSTPLQPLPSGFAESLHARLVSTRRAALLRRVVATVALAACLVAFLAVRPLAGPPQPLPAPPPAAYRTDQPVLGTGEEQPPVVTVAPRAPAPSPEKRTRPPRSPGRPATVTVPQQAPLHATPSQPTPAAHPPSLEDLVRAATVVIRERGILDAPGGS